jgi:hypothetical protein
VPESLANFGLRLPVLGHEFTGLGEMNLKNLIRILAALLLFCGVLVIPQADPQAAPTQCDRACLIQTTNIYLAGLVAHDPTIVNWAPNAKFVENITAMKPGEGLWKTATAIPTTFKIYIPDVVSQQVGFLGVMQENDRPIELALRLKIVDGQIAEAEHIFARNLSPGSLVNLVVPRPGLLATVPEDQRSAHDELLKIGATYYEALVSADANDAPFADDCVRRENGMQTTSNPPPKPGAPSRAILGSMSCAAQLRTHTFDYIKRIEPRRVWIADPETGLVLGLSQFRHPMEQKFVAIVGVPGVDQVPLNINPFDMPAAHVFKISGGKIHEVEAMGFTTAYNSKTGWE